MWMSVPAIVSIGIALVLVLVTYLVHPDPHFLITVLPMLLVLVVVPMFLTRINRRCMDNMEVPDVDLYRIKDLVKLHTGALVRTYGIVEAVSLKWLNRPFFLINDGSGVMGVIMFTAPRENIKPGDTIEVLGSLRSFGLSKEMKIWGVKITKKTGS